MAIKIQLSNSDEMTIIDDCDYEKVARYTWRISPSGYACAKINRKHVRLHRYIFSLTDPSVQVDHINGNRLDNRRENLRLTDRNGNAKNKGKHSTWRGATTRSKFKGVYRHTSVNGWYSAISTDGKRLYLGLYTTEEMAALAYDKAARELFGEYARLNFPNVRDYSVLRRGIRPPKREKIKQNYRDAKRPSPNYLSVGEVMAIKGISRQRVHQLIKAGRLSTIRVGHHFFIDRDSI